MEMKKTKPRQRGRLSMVRYMMKTQPSWEAASYTVKKLVAEGDFCVNLSLTQTLTQHSPNSSKPLKPRSLRDSSSGRQIMFSWHW